MEFEGKLFKEKKIYSQSGQDAFALHYFNNKKNGVFVEIGAANGIGFSNCYYLEMELEWTGICVEPNPDTFTHLEKNRTSICINAAIVDVKGNQKFTVANNLSGLTQEYDPRHVKRIEKSGVKTREVIVETLVLSDVLEQYGLFYIDYLSIDTEGNEFKILKSINFDRFDIELLTVENNYRDPKQTEFMISKGYVLIGKLGADDTFSKIR